MDVRRQAVRRRFSVAKMTEGKYRETRPRVGFGSESMALRLRRDHCCEGKGPTDQKSNFVLAEQVSGQGLTEYWVATRSGRSWSAEKSCGKTLRPFRSAVLQRPGRSSIPVVFDGDHLDVPAARSFVKECITRMRAADRRYMGGRIWIGIGGTANRAGIDDQRCRPGVYHARQMRVRTQQ
jgi:hypothetical protein